MEIMGIQKCCECKKRFKWSQILKSLILSYRPISCNHCGTKYKITYSSRYLPALLIFLPILVLLTPHAKNQSFTIPFFITVALIYSLLITMILPFLMKYDYPKH
ncbi:TIGR04104 family putative zinc finger protein [Paenisporosarcina indica]|uniref:TIGR04104 family putative zinc finger protein n=1 Tax=Paenisporosarcina indica TaxID=650093 RepID=UPI0009FFF2E0